MLQKIHKVKYNNLTMVSIETLNLYFSFDLHILCDFSILNEVWYLFSFRFFQNWKIDVKGKVQWKLISTGFQNCGFFIRVFFQFFPKTKNFFSEFHSFVSEICFRYLFFKTSLSSNICVLFGNWFDRQQLLSLTQLIKMQLIVFSTNFKF